MLKSETNNLNLFEFSASSTREDKYKNLKYEIDNIEPDNLSPKEALEVLYKLKNSVSSAE